MLRSTTAKPLPDSTAKRLHNLTQGCRASRLPWDASGVIMRNPNGVMAIVCENRHNPVGVDLLRRCVPQGSREARQPWAKLRNRFAVQRKAGSRLLRGTEEGGLAA
jgi:hypothetical protein